MPAVRSFSLGCADCRNRRSERWRSLPFPNGVFIKDSLRFRVPAGQPLVANVPNGNTQHLSLVALNFSEQDVTVPFIFDRSGPCFELLHGQDNFQATGQERWLSVPRHCERIWSPVV